MTIDDLNAINAKGCREVQMTLKEYDERYRKYKTKLNSYDKETKIITVYIPDGVEVYKPKEKHYKEVAIPYWLYKAKYSDKYDKKTNSYNSKDGTVIISVPENVNIEIEEQPEPIKTVWYEVKISELFVIRESKSSMLVMLPAYSQYFGYCVWISKKLVYDFQTHLQVNFSSKFKFKLFKECLNDDGSYGKGDELELNGEDFKCELELAYERSNEYTPPYLEPVHTTAIKELMDIE